MQCRTSSILSSYTIAAVGSKTCGTSAGRQRHYYLDTGLPIAQSRLARAVSSGDEPDPQWATVVPASTSLTDSFHGCMLPPRRNRVLPLAAQLLGLLFALLFTPIRLLVLFRSRLLGDVPCLLCRSLRDSPYVRLQLDDF